MNVKQRLERRMGARHATPLKHYRFIQFCATVFGGKLEPWRKRVLLAYRSRGAIAAVNGAPVVPSKITSVGLLGRHADTIIIDDPWENKI